MSKKPYVVVWNESKREGVILLADDNEDEAMDDAYHAGGGMSANPVSSIADNFRECYGSEQQCFIQFVDIDTDSANKIEKDF